MPASASGSKTAARHAGLVRHLHERDLRDVPVVGEAANLVPLLHERVLLDERSGGVLERAEDLDDDFVDPAQLDRPGLHDLGALVGELEHLLVADDVELAGLRGEARIRRVDPADVGEDLAAVGVQARGKRDGRGVAAAPAERGDVGVMGLVRSAGCAGGSSLETRDDHDFALVELAPDAGGLDAGDPGLAVAAVRRDAGLRPAQADRLDAHRVERHRDERRALVLTGREQHVELALVRLLGDRGGEAQELVGRVAHRRDDDDEVCARRPLARNPPRNAPDPVRVGEARAAELLHDERSRHRGILPRGSVRPGRDGRPERPADTRPPAAPPLDTRLTGATWGARARVHHRIPAPRATALDLSLSGTGYSLGGWYEAREPEMPVWRVSGFDVGRATCDPCVARPPAPRARTSAAAHHPQGGYPVGR